MENRALQPRLRKIRSENKIIGLGRPLLRIMELADSYAKSDFPVLITGESGTGKELIVKRVHQLSNRKDMPFLVQNCSAIPEFLLESELFGYKKGAFTGAAKDEVGLFEAADGGTVFLDKIGDMPLNMQARILRVIQNSEIKPLGETRVKKVDVRFVTATNKKIREEVAENNFRQDLFYRLSVLPLHLPPLRERQEDIPLLADYFIEREASKMGISVKKFSANAMELLMSYLWPGNIRELENLVKRLLVITDSEPITSQNLPACINESGNISLAATHNFGNRNLITDTIKELSSFAAMLFGNHSWEEVERAYVLYRLEKNNWNISQAAIDAMINRSTFVSRMKRLGIKK